MPRAAWPFVVRELINAGLAHEDVMTVWGPGLSQYAKEPFLRGQQARVARWPPRIRWTTRSCAPRPIRSPADGGLKLLGAISAARSSRSSAVDAEVLAPRPRRRCVFDSPGVAGGRSRDRAARRRLHRRGALPGPARQRHARAAQADPRARRASWPRGAQAWRFVTDGRMSGASGKVPSAIHLTPEAAAGGPIVAAARRRHHPPRRAARAAAEVLVDAGEFAARAPASADLAANEFRCRARGSSSACSGPTPTAAELGAGVSERSGIVLWWQYGTHLHIRVRSDPDGGFVVTCPALPGLVTGSDAGRSPSHGTRRHGGIHRSSGGGRRSGSGERLPRWRRAMIDSANAPRRCPPRSSSRSAGASPPTHDAAAKPEAEAVIAALERAGFVIVRVKGRPSAPRIPPTDAGPPSHSMAATSVARRLAPSSANQA